MIIQQQISLKQYNTFGVEATASFFAQVASIQDLQHIFSEKAITPLLVLGGGSNLLLTKNFNGLVVKIASKGIEVTEEGNEVYVTAQAGELWNDVVLFCVQNGYGGAENLTLIPGSIGAAPIQNIGAYGVELKDVFYTLEAFEISTQKMHSFDKEACKFAYRESIFKNELRGKYIITSVTLKLSKIPALSTHYGAIESELQNRGIAHPSIKDISDVVAHIRVSKLPDPKTIGNSGSFFKNPIITSEQLERLVNQFPDIVHYPAGTGAKLAAGWLIDQCGWKGKVVGNTGTWKNQALVLVNHGGATGKEIYDFSESIIVSVYQKFGITLEREVNIL